MRRYSIFKSRMTVFGFCRILVTENDICLYYIKTKYIYIYKYMKVCIIFSGNNTEIVYFVLE